MSTKFTLISAAFNSGDPIPAKYTYEGQNISPPLRWQSAPENTKSFALIVDDPDAPTKTFVHWVIFNLPPDVDTLPEALDIEEDFKNREFKPVQGTNDFGDSRYGGPRPPRGDDPHHYYFRLYALDTVLDLSEGVTKKQLTQAMQGHILDETDVMGTFQRRA